jgi:hypothetical protein
MVRATQAANQAPAAPSKPVKCGYAPMPETE